MNKKGNINVTLPEDVYTDLNTQAQEVGVSLSALIRLIVIHAHQHDIRVTVNRNDLKWNQIR